MLKYFSTPTPHTVLHLIKERIKSAAHKNADVDGMCKQDLSNCVSRKTIWRHEAFHGISDTPVLDIPRLHASLLDSQVSPLIRLLRGSIAADPINLVLLAPVGLELCTNLVLSCL